MPSISAFLSTLRSQFALAIWILIPILGSIDALHAVEIDNSLVTIGLPSDTGNGGSGPSVPLRLISADGRFIVFESDAQNLIDGVVDRNNGYDVFLYDEARDSLTLVSQSSSSATTAANGSSFVSAISSDGEWVLFNSYASNLVAGAADGNGVLDAFLYQRSTGAVTLVSRTPNPAPTTGDHLSVATHISADGEWVVFYSGATNLVDGVIDLNGYTDDLFLFQRGTGTVTLISKSANGTTTANGYSHPVALSDDGDWVLFTSMAINLVDGLTDNNLRPDVFLYRRSSGVVTIVSRSATSSGTAMAVANDRSTPVGMSEDGEWVLFGSEATDLIAGQTDSSGTSRDAFLYQHSTGSVTLVSRASGSTTQTANLPSTPTAISSDGEWVLFHSGATNLVAGLNDNNNTDDAWLFRRSTGEVTLISRSSSTTTSTANGSSFPSLVSADGEWVVLNSRATNLVAGVADTNSAVDTFVFQRSTGAMKLVSRRATSGSTASGDSYPIAMRGDGGQVLVVSVSTDLVSGAKDLNRRPDVFLYQNEPDQVELLSRVNLHAKTSANSDSRPCTMSADGEWVLLGSKATNLIEGVTDSNGHDDVFLLQRSTGAVTLVSRSSTSATTTANGPSKPTAISADGEWVLFSSDATNLAAGISDSNGLSDLFLFHRQSGATTLVSRSATSATTTANNVSIATAISADGGSVIFSSFATNLVPGVVDSNNQEDAFLFQRHTGAVTLISRSSNSGNRTANGNSRFPSMSADGEWLLFLSSASDLIHGGIDDNGTDDLFLYQRSTGAVTLVSRSLSSATTAANGTYTSSASISADSDWVLFQSNATDLISGMIDSNGFNADVFLYQRSTGEMTLVSHSTSSPLSTARAQSKPTGMSADGEWVLFESVASDLVAGVDDWNWSSDAFLFQRSTGAISLVTRSAASPLVTANNTSIPTAISADGEWVLIDSNSNNLVAGTTIRSTPNVYLFNRARSTMALITRSVTSPTSTANGWSTKPVGISANGEWVLYESNATDLAEGVLDGNQAMDAFIARISNGVFASGFEQP